MSHSDDLERRLRRLEDRAEICELIARYGLVMDDRDLDGMREIFTPDAVVRSADGVIDGRGIEAVIEQFRGRFRVLGPSNHFTHDKIICFDGAATDRATGLVLSHAEMQRKGEAMLTAMRYHDTYQRHEGLWKFRERLMTFFYYVPTREYLEAFSDGLATRMRAYGRPMPADWPESLPTWKRYYGV